MVELMRFGVQVSRTMPIRHGCAIIPEYQALQAISEIRGGKKYLLYLRNTGYNCFLSCIAWFFIKDQAKDPLDASSLDYLTFFSKLNLDGIDFGLPVTIDQIKKFVRNNQNLDCLVNILAVEKNDIYAYETGIGKKNGQYESLIFVN